MIYSGSRRVNSEAAEHEYLSAPSSLERPGDQEAALNEKLGGERGGLGGKWGLGSEGGVDAELESSSCPHCPAQTQLRGLGSLLPLPSFPSPCL